MNASEYFQVGQLNEALTAVKEEIRKNPTDQARRGFLAELLCFAGDLEKADTHLDAVGHQDPEIMMGVSLFRHLVRAEQARQQFYTDGRLPEFLEQPSPALRLHLEAAILIREGKGKEAAEVLARAEDQRPKPAGTCNGKPFADLRDLDDLTACFFEVLTSTGKYYWIPMEKVEQVEFRPPSRPRDLLWQRAHMVVRGGPDGEVFLPTLYAGSQAQTEDRYRLGRATDWRGGNGEPVRGVGQRTFLVGDDAVSILELKEIETNAG